MGICRILPRKFVFRDFVHIQIVPFPKDTLLSPFVFICIFISMAVFRLYKQDDLSFKLNVQQSLESIFGYLSKFKMYMSFTSAVLLICAHLYKNLCAEIEKTGKNTQMDIKMTDSENYSSSLRNI